MRTLTLPQSIRDRILNQALGELPFECCGLLAGELNSGHVSACYPIGNRLRSPTEFETEPLDLLRAFRAIRQAGTELVAIYHSHPTSAPIPSRTDLARNTYGSEVVWLIVGLASKEPELRGWLLHTESYQEVVLVETEV